MANKKEEIKEKGKEALKNIQEGLSVKEIEEFAKRHRFEVFFGFVFLLAAVFGAVGSFKAGWSLFLGMGGSIAALIFPTKLDQIMRAIFQFIFRQDKTVQMVLGAVSLIIACVVPFLIFLFLGMAGGRFIHQMASEFSAKQ